MEPETRHFLTTYGLGGLLVVIGFLLLRTSASVESWMLMFSSFGMLFAGMVRIFAPNRVTGRH